MRSLAARIIVALVLLAAAWWARAEAQQLRARADTLERIATLRFDVEEDADSAEAALSAYWRGTYDAPAAEGGDLTRKADARTLLIAANAAFRMTEQDPKPRAERARQLDVVLQAYTSALKSSEFLPDAAYNYEFVVKLRDRLARARGAAAGRKAKAEPVMPSSDLPTGTTIHGRPGAPPPEMKGEEFEILTPMEYGDRETQPEPTSGAKPLRKG